jgi:hypothetical protein
VSEADERFTTFFRFPTPGIFAPGQVSRHQSTLPTSGARGGSGGSSSRPPPAPACAILICAFEYIFFAVRTVSDNRFVDDVALKQISLSSTVPLPGRPTQPP